MSMTFAEIKDAADRAELYPGSDTLDWTEIPWHVLSDWVLLSVELAGDAALPDYDVESVKQAFHGWWVREQTRQR